MSPRIADNALVSIVTGLTLPLFGTTQQALHHLQATAHAAYTVTHHDNRYLLIRTEERHFLAIYSTVNARLQALGELIPLAIHTPNNTLWLHGEMQLPAKDVTADQAYDIAYDIACQCGYDAYKISSEQIFIVTGPATAYVLTFDNSQRSLTRLQRIATLFIAQP